MKILLFTSSLGSGGAERQLVTLGLLLKQQGMDVEFLVYHDEPFYEHLLLAKNVTVHKILHDSHLLRLISIRRFIRRNSFTAVISFLDTPNFINCFSAIGGKNWRVITAERSAKESTFLSKRGKLFASFQRFSDCIVCNSENAKKMWASFYPEYAGKYRVIYNTVHAPNVSSEYLIRKDEKTRLLIAASYQYLKNPINVIKAVALMSPDERGRLQIDWHGQKKVFNGDMRAYNEACRLIHDNGLQNVVCLHDETRDIANKMYEADAVGLFSEFEGLPNVICEAMTLGKPVIMTRVSDFAVLVDKSNGILCDWDNVVSIKEALLELCSLSDDELCVMGARSREKARTLFSPKTIVGQWLSLLGE